MSGTSADGIDVSIASITGRGFDLRFELLGHEHFAYPKPVRAAVLKTMNATRIGVAELARLNFLLGELYAEAIRKTQHRTRKNKLELIGCHGQTIYHQGDPALYLGKKISCTWQTGEGAVVAARLKTPVVSDFRPADVAAGGKGAPLVPFLDYVLYRDLRVGRIALNIGGIANLTAIPAAAAPSEVLAFDTGPGNMVMDALAQQLFAQACDRGGAIAAAGQISHSILTAFLRRNFFRRPPPKTAGREEFGREFAAEFLKRFSPRTRRSA